MKTENDWLKNNLHERLTDPSADLKIEVYIQSYKKTTFHRAVIDLAYRLADHKLCIGLSGGIDSEYLVRKFHSLDLPFETIIVSSKCYNEETAIAFRICSELNINPTIIEISQADVIKRYKNDIFDKFNSAGIGGVPAVMIGEYAEKNNMIYLKAEHMIDEINGQATVGVNEWDFYNDVLYDTTVNFFMHTPEIVYTMIKDIRFGESSQHFKCRLYDIPYRDKIYLTLPHTIRQYIRNTRDARKHKPISNWQMTPHDFMRTYYDE